MRLRIAIFFFFVIFSPQKVLDRKNRCIFAIETRYSAREMAREERIQKWLDIVDEDLSVAEDLYKTKHWLYVAFMCHQAIEKTLKAYWCACREDEPPYIHDHKRLAEGCGLYTKMSDEQKDFFAVMRHMNIEARYQDYKDALANNLNQQRAADILETTKQMHTWILQKYSEKKKH